MGKLALTFTEGRGVRIGREALTVRFFQIVPGMVNVRCSDAGFGCELHEGATLELGDVACGVSLTLVHTRNGEARVSFQAPSHVAISRDAFSLDEHMAFQRRREVAA